MVLAMSGPGRRPFRTEGGGGTNQTLRVWLISGAAPRLGWLLMGCVMASHRQFLFLLNFPALVHDPSDENN